MVAVQVFGNDHAVAFAGSQGNFRLKRLQPHHSAQRAEVDPTAGREHPVVQTIGAPRASSRASGASVSTSTTRSCW
jgi:hypothetical protein